MQSSLDGGLDLLHCGSCRQNHMGNAGDGHSVSEVMVLGAQHDEDDTRIAGPDQDEVDRLSGGGGVDNGAGRNAVSAEKTQRGGVADVADELESHGIVKPVIGDRLRSGLVIGLRVWHRRSVVGRGWGLWAVGLIGAC